MTVCQQFSFIRRWLISSLIFVMSTVAPVHISLYEFLSIGGNGRQPHHQPYSLIRKSRPTNVIMHKANVCIISVSITHATYFIPSPVRNHLQSTHLEKTSNFYLESYIVYLYGVSGMNKILGIFLDNSHFMCFWDAAENSNQSTNTIHVKVKVKHSHYRPVQAQRVPGS